MTDLEITKLCVEAMGYDWHELILPDGKIYDPLNDDAQKWGLAEKFPELLIETLGIWRANMALREPCDLGRTLCECVARMQQARLVQP